MNGYLVGADVFIEAKNRHYGLDFCPAFWDWLTERNQAGRVASVGRIADELRKEKDELADWVDAQGSAFFQEPDRKVMRAFRSVSNWAGNEGYEPGAIAGFLGGSDCWFLAHALAYRCTVVTHEIPGAKGGRIGLLAACVGLEIDHANPYEMLRREQARFVVGPGIQYRE